MPFSSLGLSAPLLRAVAVKNYSAPTPIQQQAIPARTARETTCGPRPRPGRARPAAFVLPILERLSRVVPRHPRRIRALILAPTRELAAQIVQSIRVYGAHLPAPLKSIAVFGGVSLNPQMLALRGGADLVVATPGRLLDLVERNALHLSSVETLVLDEADRLFSLGFADELARVLALLPARRQNLLFSATFPPAVEALAANLLREPVRLQAEAALTRSAAPAPGIVQRAIEVDHPRRTQLLRHLIKEHAWSRVLVFVATKYSAGHVAEKLRKAGLRAEPFHGELSQGARTANLAAFQAQQLQVLVATDVAARGLDIAELPAVVNYDLPRSPVDYVHRIGRTGRAGETGVAVNFITAETDAHFRLIEKRHGLQLAREQIAGFRTRRTRRAGRTHDRRNQRQTSEQKGQTARRRPAPAGAGPDSGAGVASAGAEGFRMRPRPVPKRNVPPEFRCQRTHRCSPSRRRAGRLSSASGRVACRGEEASYM